VKSAESSKLISCGGCGAELRDTKNASSFCSRLSVLTRCWAETPPTPPANQSQSAHYNYQPITITNTIYYHKYSTAYHVRDNAASIHFVNCFCQVIQGLQEVHFTRSINLGSLLLWLLLKATNLVCCKPKLQWNIHKLSLKSLYSVPTLLLISRVHRK